MSSRQSFLTQDDVIDRDNTVVQRTTFTLVCQQHFTHTQPYRTDKEHAIDNK